MFLTARLIWRVLWQWQCTVSESHTEQLTFQQSTSHLSSHPVLLDPNFLLSAHRREWRSGQTMERYFSNAEQVNKYRRWWSWVIIHDSLKESFHIIWRRVILLFFFKFQRIIKTGINSSPFHTSFCMNSLNSLSLWQCSVTCTQFMFISIAITVHVNYRQSPGWHLLCFVCCLQQNMFWSWLWTQACLQQK